jgi:cell wall-associated NlpC family hydrolase
VLDDLIGVPYEKHGRTVKGLDCYGLVQVIYDRLGQELPNFPDDYMELVDIHTTINKNKSKFIELEKPEPFCIVTFSIIPPYVTHLGVVLEDCKRFIHIMEKRNVTIEKLDKWQKRLRGFYKWAK